MPRYMVERTFPSGLQIPMTIETGTPGKPVVEKMVIDRVTLTPDPDAPNGLRIELQGDLAMILSLASGSTTRPGDRGGDRPAGTSVRGSQLSVVAGAGFEPAAFRL